MRQDVGWLLQSRWRDWFYRGGGRPAEYVAPLRLRLFLVVGDYKYFTPLALRAGRVTSGRNAFSVDGHVERLPSVAVPASRQRWAEGRDPVGVNQNAGRSPRLGIRQADGGMLRASECRGDWLAWWEERKS